MTTDYTLPGTRTMSEAGAVISVNKAGLAAYDDVSGAHISIDYAHHEIHEGDGFLSTLIGTGKNDGDKINIYLKTPNTAKHVHMFMQAAATGAGFVRVKEGITPTGTTAQAIYNHNRNSATASVVLDNTGTPVAGQATANITHTGGTEILSALIPGAGKASGGDSRAESELILAANTAYVFEVESDASGINLGLVLSWYEHTAVS